MDKKYFHSMRSLDMFNIYDIQILRSSPDPSSYNVLCAQFLAKEGFDTLAFCPVANVGVEPDKEIVVWKCYFSFEKVKEYLNMSESDIALVLDNYTLLTKQGIEQRVLGDKSVIYQGIKANKYIELYLLISLLHDLGKEEYFAIASYNTNIIMSKMAKAINKA